MFAFKIKLLLKLAVGAMLGTGIIGGIYMIKKNKGY